MAIFLRSQPGSFQKNVIGSEAPKDGHDEVLIKIAIG